MESMEYKGPAGKLIAIQLSLGALVLLVALLVAYCYNAVARMRALAAQRQQPAATVPRGPATAGDQDSSSASAAGGSADVVIIDVGLKMVYSGGAEAPHGGGEEAGLCCSICLAEFEEREVLRMLPDCKHVFHRACVDAWLRLKPTCPNCRASPVPATRAATPLA